MSENQELKLRIKNYKLFKNIELDLSRPITIFTGRNNSGKSTAISVIKILKDFIGKNEKELKLIQQKGKISSEFEKNFELSLTRHACESITSIYSIKLHDVFDINTYLKINIDDSGVPQISFGDEKKGTTHGLKNFIRFVKTKEYSNEFVLNEYECLISLRDCFGNLNPNFNSEEETIFKYDDEDLEYVEKLILEMMLFDQSFYIKVGSGDFVYDVIQEIEKWCRMINSDPDSRDPNIHIINFLKERNFNITGLSEYGKNFIKQEIEVLNVIVNNHFNNILISTEISYHSQDKKKFYHEEDEFWKILSKWKDKGIRFDKTSFHFKYDTGGNWPDRVDISIKELDNMQYQGGGILEDELFDGNTYHKELRQITFVHKWLRKFEILENDEIFIVPENRYNICEPIFYKINNPKAQKNIFEMGRGVNKLFKIVLSFALSEGKIYLEEPESNLHPNFQSLLADMIAESISFFDSSVIIETHSEYFIRKLQFLTAKKSINPDKTLIYYFESENTKHNKKGKVRPIFINDDGSLTNDFGPGFLDEADNIAISLFNFNQSQKN